MGGYRKAGMFCGVTTILVFTFALTACYFPPRVWAHGGTPRLTRAEAGAYAVSVWTQPATPRVGTLDTSIAVMHPQDGTPVQDADVRLIAEPINPSGKSIARQAIPGAGGNRLLYHANLDLPMSGRWRVTIRVKGPEGTGKAAFEAQVQPPRRLWWLLGGLIGGIVLLWLTWRWFFPGNSDGYERHHSQRGLHGHSKVPVLFFRGRVV
jgi:hypothetical protein